jgi:hypothetical protein
MAIVFTGIERVTHEEDRLREAQYWAKRTIAERVIAGWALADDNLMPRGEDEPQKRTAITFRRVTEGGR